MARRSGIWQLGMIGGIYLPLILVLAGCGADTGTEGRVSFNMTQKRSESPAAGADVSSVATEAAVQPAEATDSTPTAAPSAAAIQRRIVYNTEISLVVEDYDDFETRLPRLVEEAGGFVQEAETNRRYADQQSGTWVARVPVARYPEFLRGVIGLGFAESQREDAEDVTEAFVDLESRIRNNRQLEERILALLEERSGKISDILEIERELARVREEIERMQGRLRVLEDRSDLATVTIRCREEQQYTPPAAPNLASRLATSWRGSLESLRRAGENLLVGTVAVIPWIAVIAVPVVLMLLILRRRK